MKRTTIKRRPMADSVLKSLEPELKDYLELDSPGLYFRVKNTGTKSWVLRYKKPNGKWAWKGLGGFPGLSGKAARKKAADLLKQASDGVDLSEPEGGASSVPAFREVAEQWYQRKANAGRSQATLSQMRRYLDKDVLPAIGDLPLDQITRRQCAEIQEGLQNRDAHNIARKVRGWVRQIFSLSIGLGLCENNPASELGAIAQEAPKTQHYPHLYEPELPEFLRALRNSNSRGITLAAIWTVLRTACRPGMVRFAEWPEFDLENGLWTLPAEKMKMRRDFVLPLARQTVSELTALHEVTGRERFVFPGNGSVNPVMSENTINKALRLIGYQGKLVGHGARHTASTLLREHGWDKQFVEAQLAHQEDGVAGVYNKAQYLAPRREMMQWYSDYLDELENQTPRLADSA